jgi:phosphoribosylformylglycinamidine synthase subunit PurQ / glutaminase
MMPHPERAADPLMGSTDGLIILGSLVDSLAAETSGGLETR